MKNEITNLLFNDIYQIDHKISEGSFGTVYIGLNRKNSQKVAIKVEKNKISMYNALSKEAKLLKKVQGIEGIPQMFYYGQKFVYKVLVLELLGLDLLQFFKRFRYFSLKTVCKIAMNMIKILNEIHNKGVIHRDLKPENITIGLEKTSNLLYLIDFGISKEYMESGKHIPYQEGRPFIGTIRFASIAAHRGIELSRKDDLESLGYLLIFFLKGKLPWQFPSKMTQKDRKKMVADLKEKMKVEELCQRLPQTFSIYLKYVKNLSFKERPNYTYLKELFSKLAEENNFILEDNIWDWTENVKIKLSKNASPNLKEEIYSEPSEKLKKINISIANRYENDSYLLGKIEEEKSELNDPTKGMTIKNETEM